MPVYVGQITRAMTSLGTATVEILTIASLNEECLARSIVYEAIMDTNNTPVPKTHISSTETPFKQRLANHLTSFRHERYENSTELSKHVWKLKREGKLVGIY